MVYSAAVIIGDDIEIAVAQAIDMHPLAKKLSADEATAPGLRRTTVKTVGIMGFTVEG